MFNHIATLRDRLAAALGAGWVVVDGTEAQDRSELPRADVRLAGCVLDGVQGNAVALEVRYQVTLIVEAGAAGHPFELLDGAVDACIGALHYVPLPGCVVPLQLQGLAELELAKGGLFGYRLGFALTTTRKGAPYR